MNLYNMSSFASNNAKQRGLTGQTEQCMILIVLLPFRSAIKVFNVSTCSSVVLRHNLKSPAFEDDSTPIDVIYGEMSLATSRCNHIYVFLWRSIKISDLSVDNLRMVVFAHVRTIIGVLHC